MNCCRTKEEERELSEGWLEPRSIYMSSVGPDQLGTVTASINQRSGLASSSTIGMVSWR